MQKLKKIRSDIDIVNKLVTYQQKLYGGKTMKLSDIKIECNHCRVYFTPTIYRAKKLMQSIGIINKCSECENEV